LLETYGGDAFINLVKMDFGKLLSEAKENREKLTDSLSKAKNEKRVKSLTSDLEMMDKNIVALTEAVTTHGAVIPVAGTLTVNFEVLRKRYMPVLIQLFKSTTHLIWLGMRLFITLLKWGHRP
jgi:lipid II:glycine glycyltransferase (peptidoglycan interpeptide bridge formation enzyme)